MMQEQDIRQIRAYWLTRIERKPEVRKHLLNIRVTADERDALHKVASENEVSTSDFIRMAILHFIRHLQE